MNTFPNNLKRLRKASGLKQEELAERLNVTRQTVSGWETGRRQPDLDTLKLLAEALDADVHELIYGQKPGEYPKFQRKYVVRCWIFGVTVAVLALFRLLVWPYFKLLCATYYWGWAWTVCENIFPQIGAFAGGAFIPTMLQLFMPVRMEKRWRIGCLVAGMIVVLPVMLFWMGIPGAPWNRWILYPVGYALLSYILPFFSGIFAILGTSNEN